VEKRGLSRLQGDGESGFQGGESGFQGGESGFQGGESGFQGGESGFQGGESGFRGRKPDNRGENIGTKRGDLLTREGSQVLLAVINRIQDMVDPHPLLCTQCLYIWICTEHSHICIPV
jgi:hypothetical protein